MKPDQDNGENADRRIEFERRQFSYSAYIPERRKGRKRRKGAEASKSSDAPAPAAGIDEKGVSTSVS
jgi:hypothetical protein